MAQVAKTLHVRNLKQPTTIVTKLNPIQKPFVWIGTIAAAILFVMILVTSGSIQAIGIGWECARHTSPYDYASCCDNTICHYIGDWI